MTDSCTYLSRCEQNGLDSFCCVSQKMSCGTFPASFLTLSASVWVQVFLFMSLQRPSFQFLLGVAYKQGWFECHSHKFHGSAIQVLIPNRNDWYFLTPYVSNSIWPCPLPVLHANLFVSCKQINPFNCHCLVFSVEQISREERKLHHIARPESTTSRYDVHVFEFFSFYRRLDHLCCFRTKEPCFFSAPNSGFHSWSLIYTAVQQLHCSLHHSLTRISTFGTRRCGGTNQLWLVGLLAKD